jgi:hypothetical protein
MQSEILPAAYPRNSSTNLLKGFTIRMSLNETFYAAVATAELGMPHSVMDVGEGDVYAYEAMVLEDEFVEARSPESALEALEMLCDEVEVMIEEGAGISNADWRAENVEF